MSFEQWRKKFAASRLGSLLLLPAPDPGEELAQALLELEQVRQDLELARQETEKYYRLYTEAQGDLRRMKERLAKARTEYIRQGQQTLLQELLPVFDDLWRAFQEQPGNLAGHPWVKGVDLVAKQLTASLEKIGVLYAYGEVGQPFHPQWYEAVAVAVRTDLQEGTIVEVHQQGYVLGKRLLRPARVTVSALRKPLSVQVPS